MTAAAPSNLSLTAAGFYAVIAVACLAATDQARRSGTRRIDVSAWAAIALFFAMLSMARVLGIEEWLRGDLRGWLRESGAYEARRAFQLPLAVGFGLAAFGVLMWLLARCRRAQSRRSKSLLIAWIGVAGMVSLIVLRTVSFSALDKLLYGPLKLNWVADIGSTLLVLGAVGYYLHALRTPVSRGERER